MQVRKQVDGTLNGNVEPLKALKSLVKASASVSVNGEYETLKEQEVIIQYEDKVKAILEEMFGSEVKPLLDICPECLYSKLIACRALFRLKGAYDENNTFVRAYDLMRDGNRYKHLSFNFGTFAELGYSSNVSSLENAIDDRNVIYVDMLFSGEKLIKSIKHLTHEIKFGSDFMFSVIGELTNKGKKNYYLKPYAIWRTSHQNI